MSDKISFDEKEDREEVLRLGKLLLKQNEVELYRVNRGVHDAYGRNIELKVYKSGKEEFTSYYHLDDNEEEKRYEEVNVVSHFILAYFEDRKENQEELNKIIRKFEKIFGYEITVKDLNKVLLDEFYGWYRLASDWTKALKD